MLQSPRLSIEDDLRANPGEPSGGKVRIIDVAQKSYEGGIEFATLDSVKNALRVFANERTLRLCKTSSPGIEEGLGLVVNMILPNDWRESAFMTELLNCIDGVTEKKGFHCNYEYSGDGAFFKTSVHVSAVKVDEGKGKQRRPQFVYLLNLNTAYVNETCARLATLLRANRSLRRDAVIIKLAPVGDRFEIDFNEVAKKLEALGLGPMSGRQIASHIMAQASEYEGATDITINKGGLSITFGIDKFSVGRPPIWDQNGAVISGPLGRSYKDGVPFADPCLSASISVPEDGMHKPIVDPTIKQAIHAQASAIVAAFQQH